LKANRPSAFINAWLPPCQNQALRPPAANAAFATGFKLNRPSIGRKTATHYSISHHYENRTISTHIAAYDCRVCFRK